LSIEQVGEILLKAAETVMREADSLAAQCRRAAAMPVKDVVTFSSKVPTKPRNNDLLERAKDAIEKLKNNKRIDPPTMDTGSATTAEDKYKELEAKFADPKTVTLSDVQDMLNRDNGMDILFPQSSEVKAVLTAKPELTQAQIQEAVEANRLQGLAHAERLAKETPVLSPIPESELQAIELPIEVRKVVLPDGKHRVALFVNDRPWKFQPTEENPDFAEDFFMAHDISRHFTLNRARMTHLPIPGGEYLTGQVGIVKQALPVTPEMYDGLIANAADKILETETGSFSFKKLAEMISYMKDERIPAGSALKLHYKLPPADLTYQSVGVGGHKAFFPLSDKLPSGKIGASKIAALEAKLAADPEYQVEKRTVSSPAYPTATTHRDYRKPIVGTDLTEVYHFSGDARFPRFNVGQKYFLTSRGEKRSWQEGLLIKKGHQPIATPGMPFSTSPSRVYQVHDRFEQPNVYYFNDEGGIVHRVNSQECNLQPIYTGCPYESPQLTYVGLNLPEGASISPELHAKFDRLSTQYQSQFARYQEKIRQILESGTLPLDVVFAPRGGIFSGPKSLIDHYNDLVQQRLLKAGSPVTVENIQRGLFQDWDKNVKPQLQRQLCPGIFEGETFHIAPFPPPPFIKREALTNTGETVRSLNRIAE
jgi:hypothetical protein